MEVTNMKRIRITLCLLIFAAIATIGLASRAAAQIVVVGTGDPDVDVPAVQAAVDQDGDIILKGHFSFNRTNLFVDAAAPLGGDGSREHPFVRITDAVVRARALRQEDVKDNDQERRREDGDDQEKRIVIHVLPGTYVGSYTNTGPKIEPLPIHVDVSDLQLIGSTSMASDEDGLPTGVIEPGSNTLLRADPPLVGAEALLLVGPTTDQVVLERITVAKLSLDSSNGGDALDVDRVQDFTIRDTFFTGGFGTYTLRSSGQVLGNYATQTGEGIRIGPGNPSSPARVLVSGNRSVNSRNGGLLLLGSSNSGDGPSGTSLSAVVCGNDLSDNRASNQVQGFGLRFFVIGGPSLTSGSITATIRNNRIRNNNFGVVIDAGFPYRAQNSIPNPRQYTGTYHLTFEDNDIGGNKRTPALITFTRSTASLEPSQLDGPCGTAFGCFKYLQDSIFDITYTTGELDGFWFDHPAIEPIDGRILENVLRINGDEIPNGRFIPFI